MPKNRGHGQAAILTDLDIQKIYRHLDNPKHCLLFDIALFTGERWGAICRLEVSDVYSNAAHKSLHPCITFKASTRKASPKGEKPTRQVPIHQTLKAKLKAYDPPLAGYLFPNKFGVAPISMDGADKILRSALEKAGLANRGISTHSTRRTFITKLYNQGVDLYVLKKLTGHRSISSLIKYIEVPQERVNEAIDLL